MENNDMLRQETGHTGRTGWLTLDADPVRFTTSGFLPASLLAFVRIILALYCLTVWFASWIHSTTMNRHWFTWLWYFTNLSYTGLILYITVSDEPKRSN